MARCSVADLSRSGAPALECEAAVRAPALRHALRQLPAPGRPAPDVRLAVRQRRTRRVRRCGFRADGRGRARAGARARDRVVRGGAAATRAGGRFFACRDRGVFRRSRVAATDPWTSAPPPMAAAAAQGLPHVVRASLRPSRASLASRGAGLMPEWPDLHVVRRRLEKALVGREIVLVRVGDPTVLRSTRPVETALAHRRFTSVRHRGKFLLFDLDKGAIVVNPMLAGVFELADADAKLTRTTALSLVLDDSNDLRYRDDKRMGKVYVLDEGERMDAIHGFAELGPEAGDLPWDESEFAERARATRRELRNLLMDQSFVAGIGNAYADEILWEARLHPKRRVATLSDEEPGRLFDALRSVIGRGVSEVEAGLPPELGTKVRDHMKVRGHKGRPCPRCGTPIVKTRHGLDDMHLCPHCQPPPRGQIR